jgi:hypothetical protein
MSFRQVCVKPTANATCSLSELWITVVWFETNLTYLYGLFSDIIANNLMLLKA